MGCGVGGAGLAGLGGAAAIGSVGLGVDSLLLLLGLDTWDDLGSRASESSL